ncbi:MAG: helix-turn-helix domain-containing protein [Acidobacteriota bacterium]|nr:helix-turn-helix domain-containing protein [Acidobacteriota bacterium]
MNLSQIHERLRMELLRRIERGTVSVSLLARQTGFGQSHLSNFLHNRRQLSLEAIDKILSAQSLSFVDLLPAHTFPSAQPMHDENSTVPVVTHETAIFERYVRPAAIQSILHAPVESLSQLRISASAARRSWQRFIAVQICIGDARAMDPLLLPGSICVLDRHYASTRAYHANRPTLFGVRNGSRLILRYAETLCGRLILRPHNTAFPLEALEIDDTSTIESVLIGRVALVMHRT